MIRVFFLLFLIATPAVAEEYAEADVRIVQQALADSSYDVGRVDGEYGRITARAIQRYQADWKLKQTGRISDELIERLTRKHALTRARSQNVENQDCMVAVAQPQARETITYTGLCEDRLINGPGKRVWRYMHLGKWITTTYEGQFLDGKKHGPGKFSYANGESYEGEWRNDKPNGEGIYVWSKGVRYEGEWRDGIRHGKGSYKWRGGNRYEGEWQEGKKHGHGIHTWPKGNRYEGEWRDDEKNGRGVFTSKDGDRYEGDYSEGEWSGKGTAIFSDGSSYGGGYLDGLQHGYGIFVSSKGTRLAGNWVEGELTP